MIWWLLLVGLGGLDSDSGSGVPELETIFLEQQESAWQRLMPEKGRVRLDLRPLLHDFGYLSPNQITIGFEKLMDRYQVLQAKITNSQSDTNYGWLDIYLDASLLDRRNGMTYHVIFSVQFKITASRWTVNRWVVQDVF